MAAHWTLRKKILLGYGITLALMAGVVAWGVLRLHTLGTASEAILRENYQSIAAAGNMIHALDRQENAALLTLMGNRDEGVRRFREEEAVFLQWLGRAKDNVTIAGEGDILGEIERGYPACLVAFSELDRRAESAEPMAQYRDALQPAFSEVRNACGRLRLVNQDTMFQASDRAREVSRRSTWSMIIIGIGAVGTGLTFSLFLSTLLVRPLRQIMAAAQRVSEGDYEAKVTTSATGELGRLADGFNDMVRKLKVYNDLNVQKILEEKGKSEAIIRGIDDGIVVVDANGKVINMNPSAAAALGMQPPDWADRHFLEAVKSEELFAYIREALETGRAPQIPEGKNHLTLAGEDGERHFEFAITPVRARGDSLAAVVLLLRDITKLHALDRLKSEFVMAASHELRTPLTSIGMSISLLRETASAKLTDKECNLLAVAHEETERIKALVSDLLDLSRIEAGKVEMAFDRVGVDMLCEKAAAALKMQAEKKGVDLACSVPKTLPQVAADPTKIAWVLTNLIANALRYTERGGQIQLSAERVANQIHLSVTDTGAGIPHEYQSRIFDKFIQVKGRAGGTGLGLSICREIVRAHGGAIWVESEPGVGSVFTFTLPITE